MAKTKITATLQLNDGTEYEIPAYQFDSVDSFIQSQSSPDEYYTGILASSGSLDVIDSDKGILSLIDDGSITADSILVTLSFNGTVLNTHITSSMDYTLSDYNFTASLTDSLINFSKRTYSGREQTDYGDYEILPIEDAVSLTLDSGESVKYKDKIYIGNSFHGTTHLSPYEYAQSIRSYYTAMEEQDLETLWGKICEIAQLQVYKDGGDVYLRSARPRAGYTTYTTDSGTYTIETPAIYIPLKNQFSDSEIDLLPDNVYTKVNVEYTQRYNYAADNLPIATFTATTVTFTASFTGSGIWASYNAVHKNPLVNLSWDLTDSTVAASGTSLFSSIYADGFNSVFKRNVTVNLTPTDNQKVKISDDTRIESISFTATIQTLSGISTVASEETISVDNYSSDNSYFPFTFISYDSMTGNTALRAGSTYLIDPNGAAINSADTDSDSIAYRDKYLNAITGGLYGGILYTVHNGVIGVDIDTFIMASEDKTFTVSSSGISFPTGEGSTIRLISDITFTFKLAGEDETITYSVGADTSGDHTYTLDLTDNELIQGDSYYHGDSNINMVELLAENIFEDYVYGIKSASVTVSPDDYYYTDEGTKAGTQAKSIAKGELISVGDIVKLPQHDSKWLVTGADKTYDGRLLIDLQLQEITDFPAAYGTLAYTLSSDGTYYSVSGIGTYSKSVIIIPSTYNGLPVEQIGEDAFENDTTAQMVIIPSSVTYISRCAFSYCTSLVYLSIPSSVTSIISYTFRGCTALTDISFPSSLLAINSYAFVGCTALSSVTIPASVTSIGISAFNGCTSLTSVTFEDTSGWTVNETSIDVSDPAQNATYLTSTYVSYTWTKSS